MNQYLIPTVDVIPREIWNMIGLHLRPRHLVKLMLTCKTMNMIVNNETYWTRVAAHIEFTYCSSIDMIPTQMYYLTNLECGYYEGMNKFLQMIDEIIDDTFSEYQGMNLRMQILSMFNGERIECGKYANIMGEVESITMKEFAKRRIVYHAISNPKNSKMVKFVQNLEDSNIPTKFKREIMRSLADLLWNLEPNHTPRDILNGICCFD